MAFILTCLRREIEDFAPETILNKVKDLVISGSLASRSDITRLHSLRDLVNPAG